MRERLARLGHGWLLAAIVVVAFLVRTVPLFSDVFTRGGVNYQDTDAWYHMRLIENLARHFPHRASVDPYLGADAPVVAVAFPIQADEGDIGKFLRNAGEEGCIGAADLEDDPAGEFFSHPSLEKIRPSVPPLKRRRLCECELAELA
jgi:hypothetical protein